MGNSLGGKRRRRKIKIIKISGETFKLKAPATAGHVLEDYPGYVLLDSESVKHYGIRSKPLELHQILDPKRLYLLIELPKLTSMENNNNNITRRVMSGISMSAKDRLESLMLARRSSSDLSSMRTSSGVVFDRRSGYGGGGSPESEIGGSTRVTMRLPKAVVAKLMEESEDDDEVAKKITELCIGKMTGNIGGGSDGGGVGGIEPKGKEKHVNWRGGNRKIVSEGHKKRRVSFLPPNEGDIHLSSGY